MKVLLELTPPRPHTHIFDHFCGLGPGAKKLEGMSRSCQEAMQLESNSEFFVTVSISTKVVLRPSAFVTTVQAFIFSFLSYVS